jgi:nucleotide-binding universal stress UspA family protein
VPPGEEPLFELGTDGPRSILVGVDGSTTSRRAGWYAAGLARRQRASVTAVYVAPVSARLAVPAASAEAARLEAEEQVAEGMRRRADGFPGSSAFPSPS